MEMIASGEIATMPDASANCALSGSSDAGVSAGSEDGPAGRFFVRDLAGADFRALGCRFLPSVAGCFSFATVSPAQFDEQVLRICPGFLRPIGPIDNWPNVQGPLPHQDAWRYAGRDPDAERLCDTASWLEGWRWTVILLTGPRRARLDCTQTVDIR
jgi:hypothetical protein